MTIEIIIDYTLPDPLLVSSAYGTIEQGDLYFALQLNTDDWDDASTSDKSKALIMATQAINQLTFQGRATPTALAAHMAFPRGAGGGITDFWLDDIVIPTDVINASYEEAKSLLAGNDPHELLDNLRITSDKYAQVGTTYDEFADVSHIRSGITSRKAWNLLKPFFRDKRTLAYRRLR